MIRDADGITVNVLVAIPTATESKASERGCCGSKPTEYACKTKHAHDHGHFHDDKPAAFNPAPDFKKMTTVEKVAWNKGKRDRLFG